MDASFADVVSEAEAVEKLLLGGVRGRVTMRNRDVVICWSYGIEIKSWAWTMWWKLGCCVALCKSSNSGDKAGNAELAASAQGAPHWHMAT